MHEAQAILPPTATDNGDVMEEVFIHFKLVFIVLNIDNNWTILMKRMLSIKVSVKYKLFVCCIH